MQSASEARSQRDRWTEKFCLERLLILPPDVFGPMPTSDGGPFHPAGVPLVNFLTAPFYLLDAIDALDKIHRRVWCRSLAPRFASSLRLAE